MPETNCTPRGVIYLFDFFSFRKWQPAEVRSAFAQKREGEEVRWRGGVIVMLCRVGPPRRLAALKHARSVLWFVVIVRN